MCFSLVFLAILTFINARSVRWSTRIQDLFTVAKLLALGIVIATGLVMMGLGEGQITIPGEFTTICWKYV